MELKECFDELYMYTELMNEIMPNMCCESAKEEVLGEILDDVFELIEQDVSGTVSEKLKTFRVLILNDESLTSEEKLQLQSLL
ncbi:MAG: hypothetical protein KAS32_08530 [Candidatus Peribacteraceae bacterium]|nr:hypothetical protein [Candidatus Peribacteraceae bacterium]